MGMTRNQILEALENERIREGLSHNKFAETRLGIDPGNWHRIREQGSSIGMKATQGIATHYPWLYARMMPILPEVAEPVSIIDVA